MNTNLKFYSLLHLDEKEVAARNFYSNDFQEQIKTYLNMASTLSSSLKAKGLDFVLLTNQKSKIEHCLGSNRGHLNIEEIKCSLKIPEGIHFYSAHFKLDAFRHLAEKDSYSVFCDLDMICINDIPRSLLFYAKHSIPMWYDISDQVIPAFGSDAVIRDLETILGTESEGRWSGGEFIAGEAEFFARLVEKIDSIFKDYITNISSFHHVSDEPPTSAALEQLRRENLYIADAGKLGIIGRFWSIAPLHPQKPFDYYKGCFLLHLPADKKFLSKLSTFSVDTTWNKESFIRRYTFYRICSPFVLWFKLKSLKNFLSKKLNS